MRLKIEITQEEFSHLINALDDYKDFMLDKAEFTKDRPDETSAWNQKAKEVEILREKVHENVIALTYEDSIIKLRGNEKKTTEAMIEWVKSDNTEPTPELKDIIETYFDESYANKGRNDKDIIEQRQIAYDGLVIGCIHGCHKDELEKLDSIKNIITAIPHK